MKTQNNLLASILLTAGIISAPIISYAADSKELEDLRAQIEELKQSIKVIDRKSELAEEAALAKKKETPVVRASEDGFGFKSADGKNEIKFKALAQIDYRNYTDKSLDTANIDGFDFRRIRPTIEGTLYGIYDFKFTPEFGENKTSGVLPTSDPTKIKSNTDSGIVDAFIDARFKSWFQIRAGKFKPYVGLERLQSGSDIKFIERSYVSNNILPNRDIGLSVHGDILDNKLTYAVGVFNGVVDGGDNVTSQDYNSDKEYTARVFTTPFKGADSFFESLGFGLSGTHGNFNGTILSGNTNTNGLPTYKTPGQQSSFFTYDASTVANGNRTRWSPQAYFYNGPFGFIAEYASVSQAVKNGSATDTLNNNAWQVAGSWLLTGENASFKGVKPKNVFNPDGAGWGALELVARYQENNIDDKAFANGFASSATYNSKSAQSWAIGANWYLSQNVKVAADYEDTSFVLGGTKSATGGSSDRPNERTLFTRLQLSY